MVKNKFVVLFSDKFCFGISASPFGDGASRYEEKIGCLTCYTVSILTFPFRPGVNTMRWFRICWVVKSMIMLGLMG